MPRLVLCFDGTGHKFSGKDSDSNIVKIYQMLDRNDPNQYHYYQPGIGTYVQNQTSNSSSGGLFTRLYTSYLNTLDSGFGGTFVTHVLAGYKFLMKYCSPGDKIYIFGFSRGAYTARFLAEMVHTIGLLSKGNEEMVRFAWDSFSDFQSSRGNDPPTQADKDHINFMVKFKETFCRPGVNVYFLGLFDCVNSVGQFEIPLFRKSFQYMAHPPAKYIRHAISIHERRVKFKPALFLYDKQKHSAHDVKEVWFAGDHEDLGGGWKRQDQQQRLLSSIPLAWMIEELKELPDDGDGKLSFKASPYADTLRAESLLESRLDLSIIVKEKLSAAEARVKSSQPHDVLAFGGGAPWFATVAWWIVEVLPVFARLELEEGKWVPRYWPPNLGATRDIPADATIHPTVMQFVHSGIFRIDQAPKLGGDGAYVGIGMPSVALNWWRQNATLKSAEETANGDIVPNATTGGGLIEAKSWKLA